MAVTQTHHGITPKQVIVALRSGRILVRPALY
jgi:hypothetical protein